MVPSGGRPTSGCKPCSRCLPRVGLAGSFTWAYGAYKGRKQHILQMTRSHDQREVLEKITLFGANLVSAKKIQQKHNPEYAVNKVTYTVERRRI